MKKFTTVAVTLLMFVSSRSFAAHPLISDDAGTLGKGAVQVEFNGEIGSDNSTVAGSTTKTESSKVSTTIGYGLQDKLDISFGITRPWGSLDVDGIKSNDPGSVDFSFGAKWQVYEKDGFSIALKPSFGYSYAVNVPANDYTTSYGAAVVLSKELEPFAFHCNVGYSYNDYNLAGTGRNSIWNFSAAALYEARKNMKLVADIGASSNSDRSVTEMPVFGLLGAIYALNKTIDFSVGGKVGLTDPETDVTGLFGITLKF